MKGETIRSLDRRPALLFVVALGLCMLAFNLLVYRNVAGGGAWELYLSTNAQCAGKVLRGLGEPVRAIGATLRSAGFSLDIKSGCDSIQASAFLVFATLLAPLGVPLRRRCLPLIGGVVFLAMLNIFRIVTLFLVGVHAVLWFDFIHGELWQGVFILVPLVWWLVWAQRARAGEAHRAPTAS